MTKIDIFSGFLGAGKTTLIKKLIKESFAGQKVVLIENASPSLLVQLVQDIISAQYGFCSTNSSQRNATKSMQVVVLKYADRKSVV